MHVAKPPPSSHVIRPLQAQSLRLPGVAPALVVEQLYQAAFSALKGTAAAEPSVVPVTEAVTACAAQFSTLAERHLAAPPRGAPAADFSRPIPDTQPPAYPPVPLQLRREGDKIADAFWSLLEKRTPARPVADLSMAHSALGAQKGAFEQACREAKLSLVAGKTPEADFSMLGAYDVETAVQIVLMQVGRGDELDLRDALGEMKKRISQKKALRDLQAEMRRVEGDAKQKLREEYDAVRAKGGCDCSFEEYGKQRPVTIDQPRLDDQGRVVAGEASLTGPSWADNLELVPTALREKPSLTSDAGIAQTYGLSEDAVKALRKLWVELGGQNVSFETFLVNLKMTPAKTPEEAQRNRDAAAAAVSALATTSTPAQPPPAPSSKEISVTMHTSARHREILTAEKPVSPKVQEGTQQQIGPIQVTVSDRARMTSPHVLHSAGGIDTGAGAANAAALAALGASKPPKGFSAPVVAKGGGALERFDAQMERIKGEIDSISDQTALEQMQLQRLIERRTKTFEMLSNLMKKTSSTQQSIIENMK